MIADLFLAGCWFLASGIFIAAWHSAVTYDDNDNNSDL